MAETPKILLHNDRTKALVEQLLGRFPGADFCECNCYETLPGIVADYRPDVVYTVRFAGTPDFPREALFADGGPRWISNGGAGTDHFGHWDVSKVTVTNSAGVAASAMADYVLGCFLHFSLDVPGLQADKASRTWQCRGVRPLEGRTLLVLGLGNTGRAIAARAQAFGMRVVGTRANPGPMPNVDEVHHPGELHTLLPMADFIAVATPLTAKTRGLLGAAEFAIAKPGTILADVSRGTVIDHTALLDALQSGRVAAAALDVFEEEPLAPESPLWKVENLIISPHCSGVYDGWEEASFGLFLENVQRWIDGKPLSNVVDPDQGY